MKLYVWILVIASYSPIVFGMQQSKWKNHPNFFMTPDTKALRLAQQACSKEENCSEEVKLLRKCLYRDGKIRHVSTSSLVKTNKEILIEGIFVIEALFAAPDKNPGSWCLITELLKYTACYNSVGLLKFLQNQGANINVVETEYGSILVQAALYNSFEVVKYLLDPRSGFILTFEILEKAIAQCGLFCLAPSVECEKLLYAAKKNLHAQNWGPEIWMFFGEDF